MQRMIEQYQLTDKTILQSELSHYGLSPEDWNIVKETQEFYRIEHKVDPEFTFYGLINRESSPRKWKRIFLRSI